MVKVLISNATILTMSTRKDLVIGKGYIFINNGVIESIGEGEPPPEYQYPELLINGEGRIVCPGFSSAFTSVTLYPLRYRVKDVNWGEVLDYISVLSRTDVYYIAALSFMEMISRGVTTALISDIFLDNIARAAHDVGINVTLAVPYNCGIKDFDPDNELRLLLGKWHERVEGIKAAVLYCGEPSLKWLKDMVSRNINIYLFNSKLGLSDLPKELRSHIYFINPARYSGSNVIRYGDGLKLWRPEEGLGIGVRPSYSMLSVIREVSIVTNKHPLDILHSAITVNNELIGFNDVGPIEVKCRANIVMFDTSEPPGWPALIDLESIVKAIVDGDLSIETVIMGNDILVDNKETLTVGYDLVKKAVNRLGPILKKFLKLPYD